MYTARERMNERGMCSTRTEKLAIMKREAYNNIFVLFYASLCVCHLLFSAFVMHSPFPLCPIAYALYTFKSLQLYRIHRCQRYVFPSRVGFCLCRALAAQRIKYVNFFPRHLIWNLEESARAYVRNFRCHWRHMCWKSRKQESRKAKRVCDWFLYWQVGIVIKKQASFVNAMAVVAARWLYNRIIHYSCRC